MEPRTTADGSLTLYSPAYGQTLHSHHGAVTESRHVFLRGSGVASRLGLGRPTSVLEIGFGTGLNFLLSADAALATGTPLRYVALDRSLPDSDLLATLGYGRHLSHNQLWTRFLTFRGSLEANPTFHYGPARLSLQLRDATDVPLEAEDFDAIYLDAFSPDVNPELWSEAFLSGLVTALSAGGILVSYSVKGEVRRRLARLGLEVARHPGPPAGKREMLWARKGA